MKYITINTDASYNHWKNVGGWAIWIAAPTYRIKMSGVFEKSQPATSFLAEAYALANALYILQQKEKNNNRFTLVINTDCKGLITNIQSAKKPKEIVRHIRKQLEPYNYTMRHIKAHTRNLSTPRSYINNWCDQQAKLEVKTFIKERGL